MRWRVRANRAAWRRRKEGRNRDFHSQICPLPGPLSTGSVREPSAGYPSHKGAFSRGARGGKPFGNTENVSSTTLPGNPIPSACGTPAPPARLASPRKCLAAVQAFADCPKPPSPRTAEPCSDSARLSAGSCAATALSPKPPCRPRRPTTASPAECGALGVCTIGRLSPMVFVRRCSGSVSLGYFARASYSPVHPGYRGEQNTTAKSIFKCCFRIVVLMEIKIWLKPISAL